MNIFLKCVTRFVKSASVLLIALSAVGGLAQAQDYPNKSISLIVGFPPGGQMTLWRDCLLLSSQSC